MAHKTIVARGTPESPMIGDVRRGDDIGFSKLGYFIWLACHECGKERWVQNSSVGKADLCYSCASYIRMRPKKLVFERAELVKLYVDDGLSARDIARLKKCTISPVTDALREFGIPVRTRIESMQTEKYKAGMAIATKELNARRWDNPEMRDKMVRGALLGLRIRPNKPEKVLLALLNTLYPNQWKYTGDGSFIIGGINPDFVNVNGKKQVVELFGDWWHSEQRLNSRRWRSTEIGRMMVFNSYGYQSLIIWERELRDIPTLTKRIRAFHKSKLASHK